MNSAIEFINRYRDYVFYQPVVFEKDIVEIRGKWHDETIKMCDLIFSDIKGRSVLDIGCNTGYFLHEAHRRGASKVVGYEIDPFVINLAKEINGILKHPISIEEKDIIKETPKESYDIGLVLNLPPEHIKDIVNTIFDCCSVVYLQCPEDFEVSIEQSERLWCNRAFGKTKLLKLFS